MGTEDTRERILDAAEQLFAERGFAATSIRDVTAEAGVNLAAVHYHFGSKDDLVRAVFERVLVPSNAHRLAMMKEAEQQPGGASVEDLLRAFILPELQLVSDLGERGPAVARLSGRMLTEPTDAVHSLVMEMFSEVGGRFIADLQEALPAVSEEEVVFRMQCTVAILTFFMSQNIPAHWKLVDLTDPETTAARIIGFLLPAMSAPAAPPVTM
ncbi:MAG TPA: TetR/AcrR family transcriptional regulator [Gemmatimonadales bacterium]|nr:TetR/AcrR family transcriptional regulator [Gemmatimonadales bacterium]